jgi:hypothetical protein
MHKFLAVFACVFASFGIASKAAQDAASGIPVKFTLTNETAGATPGSLSAQDLTLHEEREQRPITEVKLAGQNGAGMQLLLLIDDSARSSFGTQIQGLKQFVSALPATTEIGIGYMRNGTNQMACDFTRNHQEAANSIRLAMGAPGADVSPYDSISEAIKKWPQSKVERRQIIVISSGIEALGGGYALDNPYVNHAIEDAQKAGTVVYAIYNPSAGMRGRFFWRSMWGQSFLSQLADETGGEAYNINMGEPVSLDPFLKDMQTRMMHQYIVTFSAKPENRPGLRRIKVALKEHDGRLAYPSRVFVRAGM